MKALITAPFTDECKRRLKENGINYIDMDWRKTKRVLDEDELIEIINKEGIDITITELEHITEDVINSTNLKIIAIARSNARINVDLEAATAKGIPVIHAPGRNANAVAELTIALMLAVLRKVVLVDRIYRREKIKFETMEEFLDFYDNLRGHELSGKTVGIIGLGKVGYRVAQLLRPFNVRLLVYDPYVSEEKIRSVNAKRVNLEMLLRESDIITVHAAPTEETLGLIGEDQINLMKPTAIVINTARSLIVDEDALFKALKERRIAGAGLDVFDDEPLEYTNRFFQLDNVVLTPHIGGDTFETIKNHSRMITEDILRILRGERPRYIANPSVLR